MKNLSENRKKKKTANLQSKIKFKVLRSISFNQRNSKMKIKDRIRAHKERFKDGMYDLFSFMSTLICVSVASSSDYSFSPAVSSQTQCSNRTWTVSETADPPRETLFRLFGGDVELLRR